MGRDRAGGREQGGKADEGLTQNDLKKKKDQNLVSMMIGLQTKEKEIKPFDWCTL